MIGNVARAVDYVVDRLVDVGTDIIVRDMETRELLMFPFQIHATNERFIVDPRRYVNPFAQVAETLWMLSGRNDLDWLETYIPQCKKFSDDGKTWRAGYGPRLRNWSDGAWGGEHTDQVEEVINKLVDDPFTRQAVISIWDPSCDWVQGSKDYPCNNWLHFIVRDDELHLNVGVRSNDLIWGFTHVDFFGWSVLQELIANAIGVGLGKIFWNATSLHVYERHAQLTQSIYATPLFDIYEHGVITQPIDITTLTDFDSLTQLLFSYFKDTNDTEALATIAEESEWMFTAAIILAAHAAYKDYAACEDRSSLDAVDFISRAGALLMILPNMLDVKIAAIYWLWQKVPDFTNFIFVSEHERTLLFKIREYAKT